MTDTVFATTSDLASTNGEWFRPADHEGKLILFLGGVKGEGVNNFGDEYTKCREIVVLDGEPQRFTERYAELTNAALRRAAEGAPVFFGRLEKLQSQKNPGKSYWGMTEDFTDADKEAALNWFTERYELKDGEWLPKVNPDEAPF